jgi:superfamily II DNA helicase RecQ
MQFQFFKIPAAPNEAFVEELNAFLRSHCVTQARREFVPDAGGGCWAFCVEYVESPSSTPKARRKSGVDYREVLDVDTFRIFAQLRDWRKERAKADGIPIYTVFTNAQLAELARLRPSSATALAGISGLGEARAEKYGDDVLKLLAGEDKNETARTSD